MYIFSMIIFVIVFAVGMLILMTGQNAMNEITGAIIASCGLLGVMLCEICRLLAKLVRTDKNVAVPPPAPQPPPQKNQQRRQVSGNDPIAEEAVNNFIRS